jgi:hypothetical protein
MTGDSILATVPHQRRPVAPSVLAVRSDPLSSPLSLMVVAPPARPTPADAVPLARLLPVRRDRRVRRSVLRALLGLAVAAGFATVLWTVIAGSAVMLGRAL